MANDAVSRLAELDRQHVQAAQRVDELEGERRHAAEAIKSAAAEIADHERGGGRHAELRQLEAALAEARAAGRIRRCPQSWWAHANASATSTPNGSYSLARTCTSWSPPPKRTAIRLWTTCSSQPSNS
jgi:hypothetical protein